MITSVYDRQNHRLTVEGHDEKENDTESRARLCTAVTTLVYTLAAALLDLTAAGQITSPDASLRPGRALLACHSSRPLWPRGVNNVFRRQIKSGGNHSFTYRDSAYLSALIEKLGLRK